MRKPASLRTFHNRLHLKRCWFLGCLLGLSVVATPEAAFACDDCEEFSFRELGVPAWLERSKVFGKLTSQAPWFCITYKNGLSGVFVHAVFKGSPAENAGIRKFDKVTHVGGTAVSTEDELSHELAKISVDRPARVRLVRNESPLTVLMAPVFRDPLGAAMEEYAMRDGRECVIVDYSLEEHLLADKSVQDAIFSPQRQFRCEDAHQRLSKVSGVKTGELIIVRGSRRVLLSTVGGATTCLSSSAYDGNKPTDGKLKKAS